MSDYTRGRRALLLSLSLLALGALILALFHVQYHDLRVEGVRWFNLDKERNFPTWYSGLLFVLFGAAALAAFHWESVRNHEVGRTLFRLPVLWIGVAALGFAMSLDEMTILHENLFWKEVRETTSARGAEWRYVTQWQVLYAPAMALAVAYMVFFFANRLALSRVARNTSFAGIGCWLGAILLEGLRETFKFSDSYMPSMVLEELLEMAGAICLFGAIAWYVLAIATDLDDARRARLEGSTRLLQPRALAAVAVAFVVMAGVALGIHRYAVRLAEAGAPVPRLMRKVLVERMDESPQATPTPDCRSPGRSPSSLDGRWFEHLQQPLPFAPSDGPYQRARVVAALLPAEHGARVPRAVRDDVSPRVVLLSATTAAVRPARVFVGAGEGLLAAMTQARQRMTAGLGDAAPAVVKVDLVSEVHALPAGGAVAAFEAGLDGLAWSAASGLALLPAEVAGRRLLEEDGEIDIARLALYLDGPGRRDGARVVGVPRYRFRTESYLQSADGVAPLFRGRRLYDEPLDAATIGAALRASGAYLAGTVGDDGRFVYEYEADVDIVPGGYNMLRHAGSAYALLELYERTGDKRLLDAGNRALDYLVRQVEPCLVAGKPAGCLVERGFVKLGGSALAIIALAKQAELSGDLQHLATMQQLAAWILATQGPDGEFTLHKATYPGLEPAPLNRVTGRMTSAYYPGEALLALMRLHRIAPDEAMVDAALSGAMWLIETRDGELTDTDLLELSRHDHWLLYALNEIYRARPRPELLRHVRRLVEAIVVTQHDGATARYPDWDGGWFDPPRCTPASIRAEGLAAAWSLLHDHGEPAELAPIAAAIDRASRHQLRLLIEAEVAMYLPDPARASGGLRESLTRYQLRNDRNQHAISALLGHLRILEAG